MSSEMKIEQQERHAILTLHVIIFPPTSRNLQSPQLRSLSKDRIVPGMYHGRQRERHERVARDAAQQYGCELARECLGCACETPISVFSSILFPFRVHILVWFAIQVTTVPDKAYSSIIHTNPKLHTTKRPLYG